MTTKDFLALSNKRLALCLSLLGGSKDQEYSRNDDKLWNFKRAAQLAEMTQERALKGMLIKHLVSVFDIIDDIDLGILPTEKILDEKFTDVINYMLLLEGLIMERKSNE